MTDLATLQARLTEAEEACHALMTGAQTTVVRDSDGNEVRYTPSDAGRLQAYIAELRRQIGRRDGSRAGRRGPLWVSF